MLNYIKNNRTLYFLSVLLLIIISSLLAYFTISNTVQVQKVEPEATPVQSDMSLPEAPDATWKTFINKNYGVAFTHPGNWEKPQEVAQSTRTMLMFGEKLFIVKGNYFDQDKKRYLTLTEFIKKIPESVVDLEDIQIDGYAGKKVVFKGENSRPDLALYFATNDNETDLLTITYFNNANETEKDDTFNKIVSSLILSKAVPRHVSNEDRESDGCVIAGCDNEVCINPAKSTGFLPCIYQPVFSCFSQATCEKNIKGECGWTQTEELKSCIEENR